MDKVSLIGLSVSCALIIIMLVLIKLKIKEKSQIKTMFTFDMVFILIWCVSLMLQILNQNRIPPVYFEYLASFGACFIPVSILMTGIIFSRTKIKFKKSYLLLLVIPILSIIVLFTNDFHNLFYEAYSTSREGTVYGKYFTIHTIYSYSCLLIGIYYLLYYSIKNLGFFSKQSILLVIGTLIPLVLNMLFTFNIFNLSIYTTPISFALAIVIYAFAILKFQFLNVIPVGLQRINDRISDGYIVINGEMRITDFNLTLLKMLKLEEYELRNKSILDIKKILNNVGEIDVNDILEAIQRTKNNNATISLEKYFDKADKYFRIEINSIFSKKSYIGTLLLFKDITQHMKDLKEIKQSQDIILRQEKFVTLRRISWTE